MCSDAAAGSQGAATPLCAEGLAAYRDALGAGSTTGPVPECLLALGLMRPMAGKPEVLVPVPPDVALNEMQRPVERQIQDARQRMLAMAEAVGPAERLYREEQEHFVTAVRMLRGIDVINDTLRTLNSSCREELLAAQPGGPRPQFVLDETGPQLLAMLDRGVQHRTLYQHTVRAHEPTLEFMTRMHAAGGRFRTDGELPGRMIIYDRSVAVVPDDRYERSHHALLVEHPGLLLFLVNVFEHAWSLAEPVEFAAAEKPAALTDERRLSVLRLMVEGHTDAAIAARLGMSPRTVQNHIKRASDEFGSHSRTQLAYLLAKHGALD